MGFGVWGESMEHASLKNTCVMSQVGTCLRQQLLLLIFCRCCCKNLLQFSRYLVLVFLIACATVTVLGVRFGLAYDSHDLRHDEKRDHGMTLMVILLRAGFCCYKCWDRRHVSRLRYRTPAFVFELACVGCHAVQGSSRRNKPVSEASRQQEN